MIYAGATGVVGVGLIGLGKVGQFLKCNGSVVSAGLLSGLATAAAVPLTKKGVVYLPPEIYEYEPLERIPRDRAKAILRSVASGAFSFVVTTFLVNRLTHVISGYHLSIPKHLGVGLLAAGFSTLGFGATPFLMPNESTHQEWIKQLGSSSLESRDSTESSLSQFAQALQKMSSNNPLYYPIALAQLSDEQIIPLLTFMNEQEDFVCFKETSYQVILNPYAILARFKNLDQRDRLFAQCEFINQSLEALAPPENTLEAYPATDRIGEFSRALGRGVDAKVYAMFFDQLKDPTLQEALLNIFDAEDHYSLSQEKITKGAIQASMRDYISSSLTKGDGIHAALSGLGTLAVTSTVISTMILTGRLASWTWASYPTLRGVFPAALMATVGFGVGKTAMKDDRVGYIAALVLGTFASPRVSKLISTHQMSYWHGAGFSAVGILGLYMAGRQGRRTQRRSLSFYD